LTDGLPRAAGLLRAIFSADLSYRAALPDQPVTKRPGVNRPFARQKFHTLLTRGAGCHPAIYCVLAAAGYLAGYSLRVDNVAQNFAILRRVVVNLLKQDRKT
jgi:hypothetical protein